MSATSRSNPFSFAQHTLANLPIPNSSSSIYLLLNCSISTFFVTFFLESDNVTIDEVSFIVNPFDRLHSIVSHQAFVVSIPTGEKTYILVFLFHRVLRIQQRTYDTKGNFCRTRTRFMFDATVVNPGIRRKARSNFETKGIVRSVKSISIAFLDVTSLPLLSPTYECTFHAASFQYETSHATCRRPDRTRNSQNRGRTVLFRAHILRKTDVLSVGIDSSRTERPCAADR